MDNKEELILKFTPDEKGFMDKLLPYLWGLGINRGEGNKYTPEEVVLCCVSSMAFMKRQPITCIRRMLRPLEEEETGRRIDIGEQL